MLDNELIQKARQANLAEFLMSAGVPLVRNGSRYKHKKYDSLVFTGNAYFWNSKQEHGNAIDYLVRHMNMDFISAVSALTSDYISPPPSRPPASPLELSGNCDKMKAYLSVTRNISPNVVDSLIAQKLLHQEKHTNNAVFLMRDENNIAVGAELHGTTTKRFKGVKTGSNYGYGFNVRFSEDAVFDYALFFESALDLLSFIDYKLNFESKTLDRCILISMSGLKTNVIKHSLAVFGNPSTRAVLCVDNDPAGRAFKTEIANARITYINFSPNNNFKDWNEQLIFTKKHSKPIQRLLNHGSLDSDKLR